MTEIPESVTARQIMADLHRRYPPVAGWATFEEIQIPGSLRRCDFLAVKLWGEKAGELVVYEIKCARSDLIGELGRPEKSAPFRSEAAFFFLATPPGLVRRDELPGKWGLVEVDAAGGTRVVVNAHRNEAATNLDALSTTLLRRALERDLSRKQYEEGYRAGVLRGREEARRAAGPGVSRAALEAARQAGYNEAMRTARKKAREGTL